MHMDLRVKQTMSKQETGIRPSSCHSCRWFSYLNPQHTARVPFSVIPMFFEGWCVEFPRQLLGAFQVGCNVVRLCLFGHLLV